MRRIRYQVFVSSTYRDLQQERQAVLEAILKVGHFPAGMEMFPASDATPWDVITREIDESDYYIVVLGGMYGSTGSDGIGYTEREYDYARNQAKIPILAFLHKDPASIVPAKVEPRKNAQKKLARFRKKIQSSHLCRDWCDAHDLRLEVSTSLIREINLRPGTGWVRVNREAPEVLADAIAPARLEIKASVREPEAQPRPPTVPGSFDAIAAREALAGSADRIASFAIWADTPQGHRFWSEQKKWVESGRRLSSDAQRAILGWLDETD